MCLRFRICICTLDKLHSNVYGHCNNSSRFGIHSVTQPTEPSGDDLDTTIYIFAFGDTVVVLGLNLYFNFSNLMNCKTLFRRPHRSSPLPTLFSVSPKYVKVKYICTLYVKTARNECCDCMCVLYYAYFSQTHFATHIAYIFQIDLRMVVVHP